MREEELAKTIERIMKEEKIKAEYSGEEFIGLTEEDIAQKLIERLGNDWELD